MNLRSLVICSDDKVLRMLRRVLSDLDIHIEHSTDAENAVRRLTRQRFEAVIVDCDDEAVAENVLKSVRSAPCNKHAIGVAIMDGSKELKSAFSLGAHFVLYKPISLERVKSSFRAARALMKSERRRNTRVPIEFPITLLFGNTPQKTHTIDISEGGMAIRFTQRAQNSGPLRVSFTLPGADHPIETGVAFAWSNNSAQAGIRFADLAVEHRNALKSWLMKHSPEVEPEDPPLPCKLTDASLGGCYLQLTSPFPVGTRVTLSATIGEVRAEVDGTVRVAHQDHGMGVEFARTTPTQVQLSERFIQTLVSNKDVTPEFEVAPQGMEEASAQPVIPQTKITEDPLLDLFRHQKDLPLDAFLGELRRQRLPRAAAAQVAG